MKGKIILISLFIIALISLVLYYTLATDITMKETVGEADLTYNIDINDTSGRTITVEAGKTKVFDIFVTNKNGGSIKYALAYNSTTTTNIVVKKLNTSKDDVVGIINNDTTLQITLVIENKSTSNLTYNIVPITGYVNGGDLIVPNNYKLIDSTYTFSLDTSGANAPKLDTYMIPVMYNGTSLVKADEENANKTYKWYDYNNKEWANAVLVTDTNRSKYKTASVGTVIPETDILAHYVWIPRYKYKVWNINKVIGTDSYNAQTKGIDIVFESKDNTTGTISCNYDFEVSEGNGLNEYCNGSNGDYYTHPAFTFGYNEVEGIWIGKFQLSSEIPNDTNGGGVSTTLTPRIKPNVNNWRNNYVTNYHAVIKNMQTSGNIYGLSKDMVDSHMIKNLEYGALEYLTNSKYGMCSNDKCSKLTINSNGYLTGNNYLTDTTNSTTGNVYGVYADNTQEYVMGNMSGAQSKNFYYKPLFSNDSFSYSSATAKYLDTYQYGEEINGTSQNAYNRTRLGDGIGELSQGDIVSIYWPWFRRKIGELASTYDGLPTSWLTARATLIVF